MAIEFHVRVKPENREEFKAAVASLGGSIIGEAPAGILSIKERQQRMLALLQNFIDGEKKPRSADLTEKINAGYEKLLLDIKTIPYKDRKDKKLPAHINISVLKNKFMKFILEPIPAWVAIKLSLIYAYGLQDGVERNKKQIAHILGYESLGPIDLSFGRLILYGRIAGRKPESV